MRLFLSLWLFSILWLGSVEGVEAQVADIAAAEVPLCIACRRRSTSS